MYNLIGENWHRKLFNSNIPFSAHCSHAVASLILWTWDGSRTLVLVIQAQALDQFNHLCLSSNHIKIQHKNNNISTTVHAMTKSFVMFCSTQDGESTDVNCLVFWAHCKNGKILTKRQVYNKGIFTNFGYFSLKWDIDITTMCSWSWVRWCDWFCCIMFGCQVIRQ